MIAAVYKLIFMLLGLFVVLFSLQFYLRKKMGGAQSRPAGFSKKTLIYLAFVVLSYLFLIMVLSNTLGKGF